MMWCFKAHDKLIDHVPHSNEDCNTEDTELRQGFMGGFSRKTTIKIFMMINNYEWPLAWGHWTCHIVSKTFFQEETVERQSRTATWTLPVESYFDFFLLASTWQALHWMLRISSVSKANARRQRLWSHRKVLHKIFAIEGFNKWSWKTGGHRSEVRVFTY